MAKTIGVWGIDIGRCALKALRCRLDGDSVVADAFDYIEYPKLLSQPEADPAQLIKEAFEQFLSRNTVKGDRVAISVSGESGLARYFKPPPVDAKKISDLVKFEARQQIPFALEDVIWDYQRMAGGQEVDGFVLESEIGLFAMKREQVAKALAPFKNAAVEVDIIQLAPISVYNYITYDQLKSLPEGQEYNPEDPPPSTVLLSIGTDTTDLVITNGYRVWQRNIPLGGNHFTKQLSKDLKLTFAKAEHLKRNPRQADDPKAIFQAMRPVFGDMVTEVQRSVGFFQSLDRKAKITSIVLLGNTVKLPGLGQYLSKHLGYDVREIDSFNKLTGSGVVSAPAFKDNVLTFATCYGLCLQALGKGKLSTNLLPREIMTERMIRAKKPWAVAALAALALGLGLNWVFWYRTYEEVHPDHMENQVKWVDALNDAKAVGDLSKNFQEQDQKKLDQLKKIADFSREVVGTSDRRLLWLELLQAINQSLPQTKLAPGANIYQVPFKKREELHIEYIETEYYEKLDKWWTQPLVKQRYLEANPQLLKGAPAAAGVATAAPALAPGAGGGPGAGNMGNMMAGTVPGGAGAAKSTIDVSAVNVPGPTGGGWVVELKGHHYFDDPNVSAAMHVKRTLMNNLENGVAYLPIPGAAQPVPFFMDELGIGYVILTYDPKPQDQKLPNPNAAPAENAAPGVVGGFGPPAASGAKSKKEAPKEDPNNPSYYPVKRYDFVVQFVWQEKPLNVRMEERQKKQAEQAAKAAAAPPASAPAAPPQTMPTPAPATTTTPPAGTASPGTTPAATAPATAGPMPPAAGAAVPDPGALPATPVPGAKGAAPPATPAPAVPEIPDAAAPTGPAAPPATSPAPAAKG